MKLMRIGITLAAGAGLALSQTAPPDSPVFEIASVKPHELPHGQAVFRFGTPTGFRTLVAKGNRFTENLATVQDLLTDAYGFKDYQIVGLADWAKSPAGEHFDIDARVEGDATPTSDQLRLMLQSLLGSRFQLKMHREVRQLPVYALVIGDKGSKLRQVTDEELKAQPRYATRPLVMPARTMSTVARFIDLLSHYVDRPVLDQTGLTGAYEYANLNWEQFAEEKRADPMAAQSSVFAAIREQLGLKLEPRKDPIEVLIIDYVERPSAN